MKTIYLSLGSNLGNREESLQTALDLLHEAGLQITRVSSVYETEPQDVPDQPWFLNVVVEAQTLLFPKQLLAKIQKIERQMGRKRIVPKGPRPIDIDILLIGSSVATMEGLTVPHPRMANRRFVLEPMVELAPDVRHPILRRAMRELLNGIQGQHVRRVAFRLTTPEKDSN